MPLIQRYTTVAKGAMILAGNALNCREANPYPPATTDFRNGSYISTNTSLVASAGFPNGTTTQFTQSSSTAYVDIPSGSTILYAQLFWIINTINYPTPDIPITFTTPVASVSISPDLTLKQTPTSFLVFQAQDVKSLVQAGGSGFYSVAGVPGITTVTTTTQVGNGWALIIVYSNPALPTRYFNINTGVSLTSAGSPSDFNFTGFITPTSGIVKGYLLVTETNGDLLDQAQIFIGSNLATATQYGNSSNPWNGIAPYSAINNMLPANILIADCNNPNIGLLDTRGTFGTYNKNPFANTAPPFARLNMDIAGWDISTKLTNNQTNLFTRVTYAGTGSGQVTSQSVQVDVTSADLGNITKIVSDTFATVGDTLTYTVTFKNTGLSNANNVIFIDTLPTGTTLIPNTVNINGVFTSTSPQLPGINLTTIVSNQATTISFKVLVNSTIPSPNPLLNNAQVTYNYIPATGLATQYTANTSNTVATTISLASISSSKQVNKIYANVGDILTYTIPIRNSGNVTANNVLFVDTIPNGTGLIVNSFRQDGTLVSGNLSIQTTLPNSIRALSVSTVVFQVQVLTIPSPNPIVNTASATSSFIINSSTLPNRNGITSTNTNAVSTRINNANLSNIVKYVDKSFAGCGDIITYTIVIPNAGNVTAQNVLFIDTIPNGTTFVTNSVYINGTQQIGANPSAGFSVPNIAPGITTTITFSVKVQC